MDLKQRTLFYRRAHWSRRTDNPLESLLSTIHNRYRSTKSRTFDYHGGKLQGLSWTEKHNVWLGHVAYYLPGQTASLVEEPSNRERGKTSEYPPPEGTDYLEGDLLFLVSDNHVILCPSGIREASLNAYLTEIIRKHLGQPDFAGMMLEPIANINKVRTIQKSGVKSILLEATAYEASMLHSERKTIRKTLMGNIAETLASLFEGDESLESIHEKENLAVRLEISFDQRRKGGEIGKERIGQVAQSILEEGESEGFTIITGDGHAITAEEIRLSKRVKIKAFGRTVDRDEAWDELLNYFYDLRSSGGLTA